MPGKKPKSYKKGTYSKRTMSKSSRSPSRTKTQASARPRRYRSK